jgi:SET domain-containing protein
MPKKGGMDWETQRRARGFGLSKAGPISLEDDVMKASRFTPDSYRLAVKRSRAGRGLFTLESIPKGACIIEYFGPTLNEEEWLNSRNRYLFKVTEKKTIDGWNKGNTARFINHSCRPNCEIKIRKGRVFVMARRAIKVGEELAYHYGKEYFDDVIKPMGCKCPKCSS